MDRNGSGRPLVQCDAVRPIPSEGVRLGAARVSNTLVTVAPKMRENCVRDWSRRELTRSVHCHSYYRADRSITVFPDGTYGVQALPARHLDPV